jgi:hypothetical protein
LGHGLRRRSPRKISFGENRYPFRRLPIPDQKRDGVAGGGVGIAGGDMLIIHGRERTKAEFDILFKEGD